MANKDKKGQKPAIDPLASIDEILGPELSSKLDGAGSGPKAAGSKQRSPGSAPAPVPVAPADLFGGTTSVMSRDDLEKMLKRPDAPDAADAAPPEAMDVIQEHQRQPPAGSVPAAVAPADLFGGATAVMPREELARMLRQPADTATPGVVLPEATSVMRTDLLTTLVSEVQRQRRVSGLSAEVNELELEAPTEQAQAPGDQIAAATTVRLEPPVQQPAGDAATIPAAPIDIDVSGWDDLSGDLETGSPDERSAVPRDTGADSELPVPPQALLRRLWAGWRALPRLVSGAVAVAAVAAVLLVVTAIVALVGDGEPVSGFRYLRQAAPLRAEPSASGVVVVLLQPNSRVEVIAHSGALALVRDVASRVGYVPAALLAPEPVDTGVDMQEATPERSTGAGLEVGGSAEQVAPSPPRPQPAPPAPTAAEPAGGVPANQQGAPRPPPSSTRRITKKQTAPPPSVPKKPRKPTPKPTDSIDRLFD